MSSPASDLIGGVFGLASALLGVAVITLLIGRAKETTQVVTSLGSTFDSILKTITLQSGQSNINF